MIVSRQRFCSAFSTAVLIGAAVLLSACSGTSVSPQPTRDSQAQIEAEVAAALTGTANPQTTTPDSRPTLPPIWTPTFTPTPAPPTATLTPSLTPTVTPTLSAADICDTIYFNSNLRLGRIFAWDGQINLYVDSVPRDAIVRFVMTHHFSGENRGLDLPSGTSILQLSVRNLPQTGQYDWTMVVKSQAYGDICDRDGWFIVTGRNSTRAEEDRMR